jgi:uncharacterized protein (TIGR02996 family)
MFTAEDRTFIRAILANPAELTAWLVYADWLDEHGNTAHAEFLRLMARHGELVNTDREWYVAEDRLQELRATLDPNWVAVFDRPKIENCDTAFKVRCPKRWENLKVLDEPAVRYCSFCEKNVYYCHTLEDAKGHARREHCVAVRLGVLRYPGDLKPPSDRAEDIGEIEQYTDRVDDGVITGFMTFDGPPPEPPRPWWKFW